MHITRLEFENFRNFQSLDLSLNQGFVVLYGPNGAGKTNFLEGIYFGLSLHRFLPSKHEQLFRNRENFFRINIDMASDDGKNLEVFFQSAAGRPRQQFKINSQLTTRAQFTRDTPIISFLPDDLNLLGHSPANRRRFLDETLSAVSADYQHALGLYNRGLKQRSLALEEQSDLEIWDEQLAQFGSVVSSERKKFITFLNDELAAVLAGLSPELKHSTIHYHMSGETDKAEFLAKLQATQSKDQQTFNTSVGPHRDDFELFDNQHALVGYLSRGQLRATTLALKILERQYVESILHERPVILLDDVFSEFDAAHRQQVTEFLSTFDQVFVTTANLSEIRSFLPATAQILSVSSGQITKNGV